MKHKILQTILSIVFFACFQACDADKAQAEETLPEQLRKSIVRLQAAGSCATGVILKDGKILTNSHVVANFCPAGLCATLSVRRAAAFGELPQDTLLNGPMKVDRNLPVFDLAVISPSDTALPPGYFDLLSVSQNNPTIGAGTTMQILGFPDCGEFTLSRGTVESFDSLFVEGSAEVTKGSSGSPVLDENFSLLGIVTQSNSFARIALSDVLPLRTTAKAVRSNAFAPALLLPRPTAFLHQEKFLAQYYREDIRSLQGFARLSKSFAFLQMVDALPDTAALWFPDSMELQGFAAASYKSTIEQLLQVPASQLQETDNEFESRLLGVYGELERSALYLRTLRQLPAQEVLTSLRARGLSEQRVQRLTEALDYAAGHDYPGTYIFAAVALGTIFLVVVFFAIPWAFSLGLIYPSLSGGFLRKLAILLLITLTWPISLFFFYTFRKLRTSKDMSTSSTRANIVRNKPR